MMKRILPKALLLPLSVFGLLLAATDVRAQDCPTKLVGTKACEVWSNKTDTTWMTIDIALKKPAGDLTTPENKALLSQYTNRLYYGYTWLRAKGHPDVPLSPPAAADMKWEYTGFIVSKSHVNTLNFDDIITTLTFLPDDVSSLRWNGMATRTEGKSIEAFALDGKRISGSGAKARLAVVQRPSDRTAVPR